MKEAHLIPSLQVQMQPESAESWRPPSLLQEIRQGLKDNPQIFLAGENRKLIREGNAYFGGYVLEHVNFYTAPLESSYDAQQLTDLTLTLLPKIESYDQFSREFSKREYEQYGKPYWSLHFGRLLYREDIGIRRHIANATQDLVYDQEAAQRWYVDDSIRGDASEDPIVRAIFVQIFPEKELADILYRYNSSGIDPNRWFHPTDSLHDKDQQREKNLYKSFANIGGRIDSYSHSYLASGHLREDLNWLLDRYSVGKKR